ncbi:MAG: hypothetical protein IT463_10340, partial [Planctomycetes bacterium]|nr:hypothetical protein [Planctomycetota bacterium]
MRIVRPAAFALLALLAAAPSRPWADDAAAPREIAPAEVEAAQAVLGAVPPGEAALLNALRYLLQPEFEAELLTGRHTRRCSLAPFEKPDHGAFGVPERVRLWAVLECGMPVSPALEAQLQRMLDQPAGESAGLAGLAVEMLAVRAALRNPDVRRTEVLISRAGALHAASLMLPDACGAKSPLVQGDYISPRWYALQLWRAALTRAAADCVPTLKDKQWQEDLRALLRGWLPECGFVPRKNGFNDVTEETACNLAAFCALRLAAEAPKGLLPTSLLRDVERRLKDLPAILARLQHKAPERALGPARILMLASLPATAAPEGTAPAEWHSTLLAAALEGQAAAGIAPGQSQGTELALVEPSASRGEREALQTALFAIALRGGLFSSLPAPLSGKSLAEIGRRMHAQAMLQASRARNESSDFAGRVKGAIADGCEFVAEQQDETGAFRGVHQGRPGNTALCLLALLHGDFDRDSKAIQRGLARLLQEQNSRFRYSYDIALMLMFFQAYHEREQREAGMLTADAPAAFEQARQRVRTALPDTHRALVDQLTKDLQACAVGDDGYGYTPLATTSSNSAHGHTDNSCSQYAILG